jgi:hypothetical protein
MIFVVWFIYGRFLSTSIVIAKPMAIAAIIAAVAAAMYISVGGKLATGYGDAVGAAEETTKLFSADDGQYDSEPANEAITVYLPSMSGVQG